MYQENHERLHNDKQRSFDFRTPMGLDPKPPF